MLSQNPRQPAHLSEVPRAWLRALSMALALPPTQWRVVLLILGWPRPVSVWWIAKTLHVKYPHAKRAVRSLLAGKVLQRSPEGLVFQPDFHLWLEPDPESSHEPDDGAGV